MGLWWHVPFMGGRGRITEFEARLVYKVSFRSAKEQCNPLCLKQKQKQKHNPETNQKKEGGGIRKIWKLLALWNP